MTIKMSLYIYFSVLNCMISTTNTIKSLSKVIRYNKIEFRTGNPYNLRWQWKFKPAYYTYPKDNY